jgi:hypothetical protein
MVIFTIQPSISSDAKIGVNPKYSCEKIQASCFAEAELCISKKHTTKGFQIDIIQITIIS